MTSSVLALVVTPSSALLRGAGAGVGRGAVVVRAGTRGSQEYAEAQRAQLCNAQQVNGTNRNPYKYVLDMCAMMKDVPMAEHYHGKQQAQMTLDICYEHCANFKSFYMGLNNGDDCWCANSYAPNTDFFGAHVCHVPCPGDKNEYCGGKKDEATAVYIVADTSCPGRKSPEEGSKEDNRRLGKAEDKLQKALNAAKEENDRDNKKIEVKAMEEMDAAIYDVEEAEATPAVKAARVSAAKKAVVNAKQDYEKMESFNDRREPPAKIVDALDHLDVAEKALSAGDLAKAGQEMEIAIGRNMASRAPVAPPPYVNDQRVSFRIPEKSTMYLAADPNDGFAIKAMEWKGDKNLVERLAFGGVQNEHAGDLALDPTPAEAYTFRGAEGALKGRAFRARGPATAAGGGGVFADDAKNPCQLFKEDSTFFFVAPVHQGNPPNPFMYSLRSFKFSDRFLRHHPDGTVTLDRPPIGMTAAQEKEFSFEVVEAPAANTKAGPFDCTCYNDRYPDLQKAFKGNCGKLTNHYLTHGIKEDRDGSCHGGPFNADCYVARYEDLQKAFGKDAAKLKNHWKDNGVKEKRIGGCD